MSALLVANAFFIGIISYGKTGKILGPPLSSSSSHPVLAKNLYGS